jgi:adenylosuccinate lyase
MKASNLMMPGNPRYQPRILRPYFGYDNNYSFVAMVQLAAMEVLAELDYIPASDYEQLTNGIKSKILAITTTDVDERERNVTHHDIRALIQLIQEILPQPLQRWIHLLLTSYDPLDTSRILQYKQAHLNVVKPKVQELIGILIAKIEEFSETVQIGRTHGQHAIPITVGFWLATILDRVICNAVTADAFEKNLVGKISGAVGAYNAQAAMGVLGKCEEKFGVSFERMVLSKLDLRPARISTQILPPEPLAYYLFSMHMLSMSLSQLGRDCRHLMRTEIGEIVEPFEATQVGSSTMAHKRNPFRFEGDEGAGVKSKHAFGKVLDNMISEHQRDLVGSALVRDFPEIVVLLVYQLDSIFFEERRKVKNAF